MANHAFIYGNLPSINKIDRDIRKIMQKFPEFTVKHFKEDNCWEILYDNPDYYWLHFFVRLDKFRRKPALNFRHSHGSDLGWWLEYEVRNQLALKYKLKEYDEGIGNCKPEYKNFNTYEEFCREIYAGRMVEFVYNNHAKDLFETLPKCLYKYIGQPAKEVIVTEKNGKVTFSMEI